jgi:predicted DNA-binding transcriptional regulator AlpA
MTYSVNSLANPRSDDIGSVSQPPQAPEASVRTRFFRTVEAATYLGLSARTLEKHRTYGTGPIYRKLGNRVVYAIKEIEAWVELGTRHSTSDPGKDTYIPPNPRPQLIGSGCH